MYEVIRRPKLPPIVKDCASIGLRKLDCANQRNVNDIYKPLELWRGESEAVTFTQNRLGKVVSHFEWLHSILKSSLSVYHIFTDK